MKFKANILIITLFLLMMSSLSALLVSAYINNLIKFSASFHNYYRGYYIANAGLELALVKTNGNVRGYGFEDTVAADSATVTSNFSGANVSFTTTINTSGTTLGDANTSKSGSQPLCGPGSSGTASGWYEIPPGGCVPIILLEDNDLNTFVGGEGRVELIDDSDLHVVGNGISSAWPTAVVYATQGFTALLTKVDNDLGFVEGWSTGFTVNSMTQDGSYWRTSDVIDVLNESIGSDNDRYILMIANTDTTNTGHYCVSSNNPIPTQYVTIDAQGTYSNVTLDLKGVRKAGLPADFCYTAISS